MRLAILELQARFGEVDVALEDARTLACAAPADLVLMPECALTGYVSPRGDADLSRFAEDEDGPTLAALAALAREADAWVAGPWIERDGERLFNAFVVFDRAGRRVAHYRKRHPWFPERWATAGDGAPPRIEVDGVGATIAICYDVHFLARESAAALGAVDLLLFPSAWVDDGPVDLRAGIFARLVDRFGVAVANANWGRGSPRMRGQGGSRFVAADGEVTRLRDTHRGSARLDVKVRPRH